MTESILRLPAVRARTGLSRTAIYDRVAAGLLPRPVKIGRRSVGWPSSEIDAIVGAHVAGLTDEEIRALVARLQASRATAVDHLLGGP